MSKRNRTAGHTWELECAKALAPIFPNLVSARSESRNRDGQKVDLINKDEYKNGRCPLNIQCKTLAKSPQYPKLLNEMPEEGINTIFHRLTKKTAKGIFRKQEDYVILKMDDFIEILKLAYNVKTDK